MAYFNYDDKKIYYTESGRGTPLLFLHGNTASSNMFAEVAGRYEDSFKVVLIDFSGHGNSQRLHEFPADLWFHEAQQVIAFLHEKKYEKVHIIGSSGGALVAINVALEAPELVARVIADSFEGEVPLQEFTQNAAADRESSKQDENARQFYQYMHGEDWEQVVDNDTAAIIRHDKEIGRFFHKSLELLKPDILMTGSKEDEFVSAVAPDYMERTYKKLVQKIGHGKIHMFNTGRHPAILSNSEEFYQVSMGFLRP